MYINSVYLKGFRNYSDSFIKFNHSTLIIGSNDVGKTNLLYSLRILLDKSFSDLDIEPKIVIFTLMEKATNVMN